MFKVTVVEIQAFFKILITLNKLKNVLRTFSVDSNRIAICVNKILT